jgi:hypothetical protein
MILLHSWQEEKRKKNNFFLSLRLSHVSQAPKIKEKEEAPLKKIMLVANIPNHKKILGSLRHPTKATPLREPWLSSTALRLCSVTLSHKGYAFAGALLQQPTKPPALRGPDLLCALPIILFVIGYTRFNKFGALFNFEGVYTQS